MSRIRTDGISVTCDEASELMIYHLRMAAKLFEAAPEDLKIIEQEMARVAKTDDDDVWYSPARRWLMDIAATYEAMER